MWDVLHTLTMLLDLCGTFFKTINIFFSWTPSWLYSRCWLMNAKWRGISNQWVHSLNLVGTFLLIQVSADTLYLPLLTKYIVNSNLACCPPGPLGPYQTPHQPVNAQLVPLQKVSLEKTLNSTVSLLYKTVSINSPKATKFLLDKFQSQIKQFSKM